MNAFLLVTLAVWGNVGVFAQSQPPPPSPTPIAQIKQEIGNTRATVSNPALETSRGIENCNKANGQRDAGDTESSANWTIAWLTGVLAFAALVQIGVTVFQACSMRAGLSETKRAADAANASAKAAIDTVEAARAAQRAVVLIEKLEGLPQVPEGNPYLFPNSVILFTFKNYGNTVAHDVTVTGNMESDGSLLPVDLTAPQISIAPRGTLEWFTASLLTVGIDANRTKSICDNRSGLKFVVTVKYRDQFDKYEHVSNGVYVALLRRFIILSSA